MKKIFPLPVSWFPLLLLLAATLLRLLLTHPPTTISGDGSEYYNLGRSLVERGVYGYDNGPPTTFRPPLYPFFLALLMKLPLSFAFILHQVQCLLGALVPVLLLLLLREAGVAEASARLASLFSVCLLPFQAGTVMTENLFNPLFLLACWLLLRSRRLSARSAIPAGLGVALAALVRPPALLLLPVFGLTGRRPRHFLWACLAAGLLLFPWSVRSSLVAGRPVLIDTNLGYNLYMGNNPLRSYPPDFRDDFLAHMDRFPGWFQSSDPTIRQAARKWITEHPWDALQRLPGKLNRLLSPGIGEISDFRRENDGVLPRGALLFTLLTFGVESLLALAFLYLAPRLDLRRPAPRFILLTVAAFFLLHMIFFGMPRYRQPLLPLFLAGIFLATGSQACQSRTRSLLGCALVMLLLFGWLMELRYTWF